MDVKVDIDPAAVNAMVKNAILESVIGKTLRDVVEKKVKELSSAWNNPIEKAVDEEVKRICCSLVQETFKPAIEAKVKEALTDELLQRIASKAWDSLLSRLDR